MNKWVLLIGGLIMFVYGLSTKNQSYMAVGTGLVCMGGASSWGSHE